MEIYNTTTGEITGLSIFDRNNGIEWTKDLINANDIPYNHELGMHEMTDDELIWWSDIIRGLNNIDDLLDEARELLTYEEYLELEEKLRDEGDANDYESHVHILTTILNDVIIKNK